ncbi:MAG: hypothetical protein KAH14_00535 [Clostridiales bacterium]|nr:hypothetical protein [Clostridiales bacterium]
MSDRKKDNQSKKNDQFEQFVEKNVTPAEGGYTEGGFFGTNSLESQIILGQTYDKQRSLKLTKGMTILWATVVLILFLSVATIFSTNGIINVIYADGDSVVAYEIKVGLGKNISIRDVKWIGTFDTNMVYKAYTGKTAILMKSIDRYDAVYDAVIVVCGEEQILELLSARYVLPVSQINTNFQEEYNGFLGVEKDGKYYGLSTAGGVKINGTSQQLRLNEADYIAMTKSADGGKIGKNVRRFLKLYFNDNE